MNTKPLILTSTVGMSREDWLSFRKPITHVKELFPNLKFVQSLKEYETLQEFFAGEYWKQFFFPCIGGSEIASVKGLNPYKSVIELFYEKVGVKPTYDIDNVAMFWGRELEEQIAEKWQYWDGDPDTQIENYTKQNVIRRCRRLNAYVQNKKFPWIFISLDRVINKAAGKEEGSLECKTISGYAADMWENGIPPMYVAQLQTQLAVCGFDHGEIALLKDGRHFDVLPFDRSEGIINALVEASREFFELVKKGVALYALYLTCPDEAKRPYLLAEIDKLAPEPDGSPAYEKYLNTRYKDEGIELPGGLDELEAARDYMYYNRALKALEEEKTLASNKLKAFMKEANRIDFNENGYVSWKENAKGTRSISVKVKGHEDHIPESVKKTMKPVQEIVDNHELFVDKR